MYACWNTKSKSLGPDGWPIEFFVHLFELLGIELTLVINEPRIVGQIPSGMNSTYIAISPRRDKYETFNDFRPTYLCNIIYNTITKIIYNMIRVVMGRCISEE